MQVTEKKFSHGRCNMNFDLSMLTLCDYNLRAQRSRAKVQKTALLWEKIGCGSELRFICPTNLCPSELIAQMSNSKDQAKKGFHLNCLQFWSIFFSQDILNQMWFQSVLLPWNITVYPGGSVNSAFVKSCGTVALPEQVPPLFWNLIILVSLYARVLILEETVCNFWMSTVSMSVWFYSSLLSLSSFWETRVFWRCQTSLLLFLWE